MAPKTMVQPKMTAFLKPTSTSPPTATVVSKRTRESSGAFSLRDHVNEEGWKTELTPIFNGSTCSKIEMFLNEQYSSGEEVFPPREHIFAAFEHTPWDKVKVVLIGQDPYHDVNQAHGLCFSVMPGVKVPPSLVNMYTELQNDIPGFQPPKHGYLMKWATEGVLMLNASLTVKAHEANSHAKCGWQNFTDDVIALLSKKKEKLVFLLWGKFAQKKGKNIDRTRHAVLECAHPSPLSVTHWRGCKTFSKCNDALSKFGIEGIDWTLPTTV